MKRNIIIGLTIFFLLALLGGAHAGWDPALEQKSSKAVVQFKKADPGMKIFFQKAYGYAIFPSVGKGAIGVGGAHGNGLVYEKGKVIGKTSLSQVTIGLQLGGQEYREIIFFEDKAALKRFTQGDFQLSAQASAVAVKEGASTDVAYEDGVAVFTMTIGGLMYEASVGGQKFSFKPTE